MPTTISGSSISTANLNLGGTFVSDTFASNTYLTGTFASNTYFQDNSSTVHVLNLESNYTAGNRTFSGTETILTSTNFRNIGLGFSAGSISWNSSNGRGTVPESGVYSISYTLYRLIK